MAAAVYQKHQTALGDDLTLSSGHNLLSPVSVVWSLHLHVSFASSKIIVKTGHSASSRCYICNMQQQFLTVTCLLYPRDVMI